MRPPGVSKTNKARYAEGAILCFIGQNVDVMVMHGAYERLVEQFGGTVEQQAKGMAA
jgi:hypothetical protein